jgi:hypothetical protein
MGIAAGVICLNSTENNSFPRKIIFSSFQGFSQRMKNPVADKLKSM